MDPRCPLFTQFSHHELAYILEDAQLNLDSSWLTDKFTFSTDSTDNTYCKTVFMTLYDPSYSLLNPTSLSVGYSNDNRTMLLNPSSYTVLGTRYNFNVSLQLSYNGALIDMSITNPHVIF